MNAVILITRYNLNEMKEFAAQLADNQEANNLGKGLVMGGYYLPDEELQHFGNLLRPVFEQVELTKVQVNESATPQLQTATMMATWLMQRYTTAPGPWAVFDGPAEVTKKNPLTILEEQHNAGAAENSGRATVLGGGRVPVGPLVVGAMAKRLKIITSISGEDWRSRARWAFNLCSWTQIEADSYPFKLTEKIEGEAKSAPGVGSGSAKTQIIKGSKDQVSSLKPQSALPIVPEKNGPSEATGGPSRGGAQSVPLAEEQDPPVVSKSPAELDEAFEAPPNPVPSSSRQDIQKPFVRVEADHYDKADLDTLRDQLYRRSGKKPHPATKAPKIIQRLKELDEEAALAGKQ